MSSIARTIRIYGGLDCCFQFLGRAKGVCGLLPFATLVGAAPFLMDRRKISMSVRVYLTIAATVAIFYGLAFLVMPVTKSLFFTDLAEARAVFYPR